MKKLITIGLIVCIMVACTAGLHLQPVATDLPVAEQRVPGITLSELNRGYKLYVENCAGCHRLKSPDAYTATKWKVILSEMFVKAKLTDELQQKMITDYLVAKSR